MDNSINKSSLIWAYLAAGLNIGMGIILLPVILRYLPADDVGLWFVFVTLSSLAQLLEMGFQPTLARNAAYVYGGASSLCKVGLPAEVATCGEVDRDLLFSFVLAARRIYQFIALFSLIVLLVAGTFYISTVLTPRQVPEIYLFAWFFFAAGVVISFYYGYINGLLQGRGDTLQSNKVIVLSKIAFIFFGCVGLYLDFGLIALGLASLASAAIGRIIAHSFFYSTHFLESDKSRDAQVAHRDEIIKMLWHNASKQGLVQFGAFLIQRGNILIATSFLGLAAAASYSMTITVLMVLSGLSAVICQLQMPLMSMLQLKNDKNKLKTIYSEILVVSWMVFLLGIAVLIFFGPGILVSIGSKTPLLEPSVLVLISIVVFLEMNHSIAASYLTTVNVVPFVKASVYSGISIISFSLCSVGYFGIYGLVVSQGIVQLAYNNWRWPFLACQDVKSGLMELLMSGVRSIGKKLFSRQSV